MLKSGLSSEVEMEQFTYSEMLKFHYRESHRIPGIKYSKIFFCKESEYKKIIRPQDRWVIFQIFYDASHEQLMDPRNGQDGFGRIVYANAIDEAFSRFMNGQKEAFFNPSEEEIKMLENHHTKVKKPLIEIEKLAEKLSAKLYRASTPEFTISHVKNYRRMPDSSVVLARMDFIMRAVPRKAQMFVDLGYHNDDYVIAEYNEPTDKIVQSNFINPDSKVKKLIETNNGVVIIEN